MTAAVAISHSQESPIGLRFSGNRKPQEISVSQATRGKGKSFHWYYLHADSEETIECLKRLEIDDFVVEALMAEEPRPRFTLHEDGAVLILRGVNLNEGSEASDMVSLRFWIEKNLVVGVWMRRAFAVRDVIDSAYRGNVPTSPADLICKIAFRLADRAEPIISTLSDQMDQLELAEEKQSISDIQVGLIKIRQSATLLRRYLLPQRDALTTFALEETLLLQAVEQSKLREAAERITRLGEELESIRERAMILRDQKISEHSEEMNRTIFILTVLSAIFLPLSLLTGLLGINVGGIPGAENPAAFWIVSAALLIIGLALWLLFRFSKLMD